MRYILAERQRKVLERFTSGTVLLAFDFDGTLAPIESHPDGAAIPGSTRKLLQRLAALETCIVVSGRRRADVGKRVRGIGFKEVIGNHGIEPCDSCLGMVQKVNTWITRLRPRVRPIQGVIVENKRFSLSVHYRQARNRQAALRAIHRSVSTLADANIIAGKQVVNLVVKGSPDKGAAVEHQRHLLRCERVIYVGDDQTDETAFALARRGRLLGIRVGVRRSSLADFYIRNQREIDRLLRLLLALRLAFRQSAVQAFDRARKTC